MITRNQVEKIFDHIRPALQANGADIKLLDIEGRNVRAVVYIGSINCLSSSKMLSLGIERALREEIAGFGELIAEIESHEMKPLFEG